MRLTAFAEGLAILLSYGTITSRKFMSVSVFYFGALRNAEAFDGSRSLIAASQYDFPSQFHSMFPAYLDTLHSGAPANFPCVVRYVFITTQAISDF